MMPERDDDLERRELLEVVSKKGLKALAVPELERLYKLVAMKQYENDKKADKAKRKLLKQINNELYDRHENKRRPFGF